MPIYEYRCQGCGHELEVIQKLNEPVLMECPSCRQPALKKLISAAGFQLKGNGWYATDFKGSGQGASPAKEDAKKEDAKKEDAKKDAEATAKPAKTDNGACGGGTCGCD
jgi:putative FmdB family regulatory protein